MSKFFVVDWRLLSTDFIVELSVLLEEIVIAYGLRFWNCSVISTVSVLAMSIDCLEDRKCCNSKNLGQFKPLIVIINTRIVCVVKSHLCARNSFASGRVYIEFMNELNKEFIPWWCMLLCNQQSTGYLHVKSTSPQANCTTKCLTYARSTLKTILTRQIYTVFLIAFHTADPHTPSFVGSFIHPFRHSFMFRCLQYEQQPAKCNKLYHWDNHLFCSVLSFRVDIHLNVVCWFHANHHHHNNNNTLENMHKMQYIAVDYFYSEKRETKLFTLSRIWTMFKWKSSITNENVQKEQCASNG